MSDSYLNFANTRFGSKLTSMLGLPQPLRLERFEAGKPEFGGATLIGSGSKGELVEILEQNLSAMGAAVIMHPSSCSDTVGPEWNGTDKVKALIFDASGLSEGSESIELYRFLNSSIRSVLSNGRVLILGRPPEGCSESKQSTAQRALEGLSRSLAKEVRNAINVQLVYVEKGAEHEIESTLRFLLSPKSAYVSGQVVRVSASVSKPSNIDWSKPLSGKRVLVTGASQGIGLAIAEVAARDGAHVICLDIPPLKDVLRSVASRLGGSEIALDLTSDDAVKTIVSAAKGDGGWDVIVHNAGITKDKTVARMDEEWWSQVVDVNLSAQERINEALVASNGLKRGGRIVCVSSISGIAGNRGQTNYAFSKAGVIGMVESQAPLLIEHGITINAVAPGFIETQMTSAIPFSVREAGRRLNSLSQGGLPLDVAEATVWFASPASSGLNGNVVRVCGQSLLGA